MFSGKTVHLALSVVFYSGLSVFGQWFAANSGTNNNLNGGYLLDSGVFADRIVCVTQISKRTLAFQPPSLRSTEKS